MTVRKIVERAGPRRRARVAVQPVAACRSKGVGAKGARAAVAAQGATPICARFFFATVASFSSWASLPSPKAGKLAERKEQPSPGAVSAGDQPQSAHLCRSSRFRVLLGLLDGYRSSAGQQTRGGKALAGARSCLCSGSTKICHLFARRLAPPPPPYCPSSLLLSLLSKVTRLAIHPFDGASLLEKRSAVSAPAAGRGSRLPARTIV